MKHLPLFFDLGGRKVVVVGEGPAAERRARLAQSAGADVQRLTASTILLSDFKGAAAAFIATQHAIEPRTKVNVARQAGHRIVEIAREEAADLIVMGISYQNRPNEGPLGRIAEHVVRNAPMEVVVDRVPKQKVAMIPTDQLTDRVSRT